ncbi:ABC transporter ATP-binding protein [Paenibacillus alvei]|uniref:ABC transporter ATP-binding protein n=1 Tax=Paenibacillus alvei TaxID=44250 RepID=UPI0018CE1156|nr:ABC transporter ATP-binding protein [Paenibacillus alvei]MBG9732929.1 bacitracin ABC transporter ATP-binding protein [Paenibacillus alvei]MBG9743908.1 bacitracin ABC transporter ATP-binding protein [Paenibacillus alvei]MCY9582907.1 ABC transporter ATP-binding protein [Paenibacillus alvei]MCY9588093.1 ABC transporter ATP-binding protein [Paenibacillus alvei]
MTYLVRTHHLSKTFQGKEVVSNVNMNIRQGEIYGFLGPNGAGKTTIMKMITNLIKPTIGRIELFGETLAPDSYHLLSRMGTIIEYPVFYDKLSARDNLELHCAYMGYHNMHSIDEALELVKLHHVGNKSVKDFSLGMKQRLGIARAISTKPELLMFDEPINGLDPIGIKEIRDLLLMLSKQYGTTILISSHLLGEIELVADTIGVINHGRLIKEVSMDEVRMKNCEYVEIVTSDCTRASFLLEDKLGIHNLRVMDERMIRVYDPNIQQGVLTKELVLNDIQIESIHKKNSSLEEYFLSLLDGGDHVA